MAAQAAARYLRQLYGRFGDWRLAVAAYNCGEGTVQKSLKHYRASSYERIATHLPAETQMYVPKVRATILAPRGAGTRRPKTAGRMNHQDWLAFEPAFTPSPAAIPAA